MNSLSIVLRITAILAAVVAVGLYFLSSSQLSDAKRALEAAEDRANLAALDVEDSEDALEELSAQIADLEDENDEALDRVDTLEAELTIARQEVVRQRQAVEQAKNEAREASQREVAAKEALLTSEEELTAANQDAEVRDLTSRIASLEENNESLQSSLEQARIRVATLETETAGSEASSRPTNRRGFPSTRYSAYSSNVESGINRLNSRARDPEVASGLEAGSLLSVTTIESVDSAAGIVALANNGDLNLATGVELSLIQNLNAIARVRVSQSTDTLAIANILPGSTPNRLVPGTSVNLLQL